MAAVDTIQKTIKEKGIKFVDIRFTDPRGKWQHLTMDASMMDASAFKNGIPFDGSSIAGWRSIDKSDMLLMPDAESAVVDPFFAQPTLVLMCDIFEPGNTKPYDRDPRNTAKAAEEYLKETGIGDQVFFGPEPEFFIFDSVLFSVDPYNTGFMLDGRELPSNMDTPYETGNMGHRPRTKGGYFPTPPVDAEQDLRSEMLSVMTEMGVSVEKHHHEVAAGQHELGITFNTLTNIADDVQKYKYVVHNVAHSFGKTATFMPKPVYGDNGTGMHCHQSIWKGGKPLFAGDQYAGLSQECLYYIGGIIKHARAINAFANPTTNSYKRLVAGYEAPVLLTYSAHNRSASCRIPVSHSPSGKRIEIRFPDPAANPYLAFSAMLMAGLDGIVNKIDPGEPSDKNLYFLSKRELDLMPHVCASLRQACDALDEDREFLKQGDVFTDGQIDSYLELKKEEAERYKMTPHPVEFDMYYSV
ncbi:MAG: type I glutamate--ammonia ligase [Parvularculales bacterium]